ncbi:MAG: GNAT family N-acetyltransferase [Janthinobacterium lividum]
MIRYLRPNEIDRQQWDDLLTRAPNGLIYALSWYLDIVSPGWAALVKEEAGRYVAVLPLPVRRKFGLSYLQQPVFTQQLGVFYEKTPTAADWQEFGYQIKKRFRYITKYAFNTTNTEADGPASLGLAGALTHTYHLSLQPTYPELLAGYRPNRRRHLRKAQAHSLVVESTTDVNLLIRIFDKNTAHRLTGMQGEAYEYPMLRALYSAASRAGLASMWQARPPAGGAVAIVFLLHFKQHIIYLFNCSTAEGKDKGAISVLIDDVLRQYAGQNFCFDFESQGVNSLERFYSSFGSKPAPFLTISANRLPWPVRQLKAARMALYQRLRSRPASDTS